MLQSTRCATTRVTSNRVVEGTGEVSSRPPLDYATARVRSLPVVLALVAIVGGPVWGEEIVHRELADAGVHVPVLTKAPQLLEFVEAEYPAEAQAAGLTARVAMMVTIAADGGVAEVRVSTPAGHGFDEAAEAAVRRFKFTPAEVDFAPAAVQVEYVYNFVLKPVVVDGGVPSGDGGLPDAGPPAPARAVLRGTLITRGGRTRIPGALVLCVNQPGVETSSNEEGTFVLDVQAGECTVRVVSADHKPYETTEVLEPGETREVNYYVLQKVLGFETVVRGQRDKKEVVKRTFSREELQKVPGTFGDPVRVVQNFPGVARAPFVLGQLIVRGANANQSLTFFDGVQIPLLFHLAGGPSIVNGEFLDRVDFFPGGFGARYGRAVGGVVDVASRKGASDTWHGVAKVDFLDSSLYLESPLGNGVSVAAAFRRSYIDLLLPTILEIFAPNGGISVVPVYWDYQVRLDGGAKRGEAGKAGSSTWSLFAFGSDDQLKVVASGAARSTDVTVNYHTNFHRLLATWNTRAGDTTFKMTPFIGYDLATVDLGFSTIRADQYNAGLRQDWQKDVRGWLTLRAGSDIYGQYLSGFAELPVIDGTQIVSFPGSDPKTTVQTIKETITTVDGALYAEADFKVGGVTVTPGVRGTSSFINRQPRRAVDPRLWVRWEPREGTLLKGSVGLYSQPPPGFEMEPSPFGTPGLQYEKAFQSSVGIAQKITESINIDLTGFFNRRFENVSSPGPTTVNPDGSVTSERFANNGLGRAYGLELLARHEVTKNFFGWVAYTLSRSEQRTAGTDRGYILTTTDQTHILTVVASYRFGDGWEFGGRFRYVTGNPKNPLNHSADVYQAETNRFSATFGDPRSARVRDFNQLDLRLDKYFTFERWTLDVYLDVQNVYNAQNVEASFYDYRFRKQYDVPGIPVLPVLGVKGSF